MSTKSKSLSGTWLAIIAGVLAGWLSACSPPTQSGVVGTYSRKYQGITDSITLAADGSFTQTVQAANGNWSTNGSWKLKVRVVELDICYLSYDDEKRANNIPPQVVYSCAFGVEGDSLERTVLQPRWIKTVAGK